MGRPDRSYPHATRLLLAPAVTLVWLASCGGEVSQREADAGHAQAQPAPEDAAALLARYRVETSEPAADWPGIGQWSEPRARNRVREARLLTALDGAAPSTRTSIEAELGQLYTEVGEYARGLFFLTAALAERPDDPSTWLQLGNNRLGSGFPREALALYDRALELNRDTTSAWAKSAAAHLSLGDTASARTCFEETLERSPRHFEARVGLARILEESGELERALEHLETALDWNPDDPTALFRLARVQAALGLDAEAEATALRHERAAILDDLRLRRADLSYARKACALGEHYLEDVRVDDALREFRAAYERAQDSAERALAISGLIECSLAGAGLEDLDALRAELDALDPAPDE